ncbi:uncharacterized protein BXIN_1216 [Babesia sp. Xinjiang]|uniref:uncharacterized protein n=1 Tax=Babesia sp. Xinjiang TaxID=462227 RepID=UPI000A263419|nr:uncharacterized protein BXIN_1216 [Babesia sp. Xinjiang]ORM40082.1 hypothetical protein BXIN_1216 [Babesia sp. Xinjiang]
MRISRVSQCCGSRGSLSSVDFQPHVKPRAAHRLATASSTEVQIWALWRVESKNEPSSVKCLCLYTFRGHSPYEVATARWSPNGRYLASTDSGGVTHILERSAEKSQLLESSLGNLPRDGNVENSISSVEGHKPPAQTKETRKYTFKYDGTSSKRQRATGESASKRISFDSQSVKREVVNPITVDKNGGNFEVWTSVQSFCCPSSMGQLFDLSWAPDSRSIVGGGLNGQVVVFDIVAKQVVAKFDVFEGRPTDSVLHGRGYVKSVAWDPMTLHIAVQTSSREVSLWRRSPPHPDGAPQKWTFKRVFEESGLFKKSQSDVLGGSRISWAPNGQVVAFPSAGISNLNFAACFEVIHEDLSKKRACFKDGKINYSELQLAYDIAEHKVRQDPMLLQGHQSRVRNVRFCQDLMVPRKHATCKGSSYSENDRFIFYAQSSDDGVVSIWRFNQANNWKSKYKNEAFCICVIKNASDEQSSLEDLAWGNRGRWLAVAASQGGLILVELNEEETHTRYHNNWMEGLEVEDTQEITLSFLEKVERHIANTAEHYRSDTATSSQSDVQKNGNNTNCKHTVKFSRYGSKAATPTFEARCNDTQFYVSRCEQPINVFRSHNPGRISTINQQKHYVVGAPMYIPYRFWSWILIASVNAIQGVLSAYTSIVAIMVSYAIYMNRIRGSMDLCLDGRIRGTCPAEATNSCEEVELFLSLEDTTAGVVRRVTTKRWVTQVGVTQKLASVGTVYVDDSVPSASAMETGLTVHRKYATYCSAIDAIESYSDLNAKDSASKIVTRRSTRNKASQKNVTPEPTGNSISRHAKGKSNVVKAAKNDGQSQSPAQDVSHDNNNDRDNAVKPSNVATRKSTRQRKVRSQTDEVVVDIWLKMDYSNCMDKLAEYWRSYNELLDDSETRMQVDKPVSKRLSRKTSTDSMCPGEQVGLTSDVAKVAVKKVKITRKAVPSQSCARKARDADAIIPISPQLQPITAPYVSRPSTAEAEEPTVVREFKVGGPESPTRLKGKTTNKSYGFFEHPKVRASISATVLLLGECHRVFATNDTGGEPSAVITCFNPQSDGGLRVTWMRNITNGSVTHICPMKEPAVVLIVSQKVYRNNREKHGKAGSPKIAQGTIVDRECHTEKHVMDTQESKSDGTAYLTLLDTRTGATLINECILSNFNVANANPFPVGESIYVAVTCTDSSIALYRLGQVMGCHRWQLQKLLESSVTALAHGDPPYIRHLQLLNVMHSAGNREVSGDSSTTAGHNTGGGSWSNGLPHFSMVKSIRTEGELQSKLDAAVAQLLPYYNESDESCFIAILVYMKEPKVYVLTQRYRPFMIDVKRIPQDIGRKDSPTDALTLQSIREVYCGKTDATHPIDHENSDVFNAVVNRLVDVFHLNPLVKGDSTLSVPRSDATTGVENSSVDIEQLLAAALVVGNKSEYVLQVYEYINELFAQVQLSKLCDTVTVLYKTSIEWKRKRWDETPAELNAFDARMMQIIGIEVDAILNAYMMPLMHSMYCELDDECQSRLLGHIEDGPSRTTSRTDSGCHKYCIGASVPCPIDRARVVLGNRLQTSDAALLHMREVGLLYFID